LLLECLRAQLADPPQPYPERALAITLDKPLPHDLAPGDQPQTECEIQADAPAATAEQ
jgi:hypothetical protein